MTNHLVQEWRSRNLTNFAETLDRLGYYCNKSPAHMGQKVSIECAQGHKLKATPHEFVQGSRCWCDRGQLVESFDLAAAVAAEERRFNLSNRRFDR